MAVQEMYKKYVCLKVSSVYSRVKGGVVGMQRRVLLIDLFWFCKVDSPLIVEYNNVYSV